MAIDRTGISSLDTGASDITYSGNEGPKSPDQQLMASADPMLVEEYDKYVFELKEIRPEATPMSFREFVQQVMSGMADGGRAGYIHGGITHLDGRRGFFAGAERDARAGRASMSPGTSHSGGRRDPSGPKDDMSIRDYRPPITTGDGPPPKDVWNVETPSMTFNPGLSEQKNRLYNIRQRQLKNLLEGDEDRKRKEKVDDWFDTEPKSTDPYNFAEVTKTDLNKFKQPMTKTMDYDTYKSINPDSTLSPFEFKGLKEGTITAPGTYTAAEGGIARLGYRGGQLVQPGPGRPGYQGDMPPGVRGRQASEQSGGTMGGYSDAERYAQRPPDDRFKQYSENIVNIPPPTEGGDWEDQRPEKEKGILETFASNKRKKDILRNMFHVAKGRPIQPALMALLQGGMTEEDFEEKFGVSIEGLVGLSPMEQTNIFGDMSQFDKDRLGEMAGVYGQDYVSQDDWTKAFYGPKGPPDSPEHREGPPIYPYPLDVHPGTGGITDATDATGTTSDWNVASLDLPFDRSTSEHDFSGKYFYGADGGRPGFAGGGDVRQNYGLGKLVKKATRAIKKVAKSPIGKAALMYGLGTYLGGMPAFGGPTGAGKLSFLERLKNPALLKNLMAPSGWSEGNILNPLLRTWDKDTEAYGKFSPWKGIAGASALGGLFTAMNPEDEDEGKGYEDWLAEKNRWLGRIGDFPTTPVDPLYQRNLMAADGGRIGYAGGGYYDEEEEEGHRSAALSAMYGLRKNAQEGGLMDLGGMEKDYREEGGFVPIGGQERADDVPARLSKNEFVFTADAVRAAGGGDIDAGAEVMENVMNNLEQGGNISEESQGLEGARDMFATSQRLEGVM